MSTDKGGRFPDWNNLYKSDVKSMPWYNEKLDSDLELEINRRQISRGRFLDLGTGPGTQAIQLAKIGFDVTGTDLSEHAIKKAQNLDGKIKFMVDNILDSRLESKSFDYILDRGCFHVLSPDKWNQYAKKIYDLLDVTGLFFLKCFSTKETKLDYGPYRFSEDQIRNIFEKDFVIESMVETVFHGTLDPFPKALFVVMRKS